VWARPFSKDFRTPRRRYRAGGIIFHQASCAVAPIITGGPITLVGLDAGSGYFHGARGIGDNAGSGLWGGLGGAITARL